MGMNENIDKFGPFGRYNEVVKVTNGQVHFSASAGGLGSAENGGLGAAAFIISGSATNLHGSVTLAKGGVLELGGMQVGVIHEMGLFSANSTAANTTIYVLKR
jgi:hypothetical protein|tara:strand:- start:87 stop:395 length:309 start_codon:yes stop_codon:yes gene_type:complete